jgi:hypothetical protein
MKLKRHLAIGGLALLMAVPGCGKSKRKKVKEFKAYEKESLPIVNAGFAHYRSLGQFLAGYKPENKAMYVKGVEARLANFKELIGRLEKVEPKNDELEKFKKNDLKMMHAIKGIFKILRDQLRAGKAPHRTAEMAALENEYKERNRKYIEMRRKYQKKYRVRTYKRKRKKKRWKKKKKKW